MTTADFAILWAAYRMGGLDARRFPEGLDRDGFLDRMSESVGPSNVADMLIAAKVRAKQTPFPVGVVFGSTDGWLIFPKVLWFPWATARNRLEAALAWVNERRRTHQVYLDVPNSKADRRLPEVLCRYGVLDRTGVEPNWFGSRLDAMRYFSRRVEN